MKKFIIAIMVMIIGACAVLIARENVALSFDPKIMPRKNANLPIEGSFIVDKYVYVGSSQVDGNSLKGETAFFSRDAAYFGREVCNNPTYKSRIVEADSYLWDTYKVRAVSLGIKQKELQVITISSEEKFFDEYIKLEDNHLLKGYGGVLIFLKKESGDNKTIAKYDIAEENSKLIVSNSEKELKSKSGVLLGLKYKDKETAQYAYRTLWISYVNGSFNEVIEMPDLLVPRQTGFWRMGVVYDEYRKSYKLWAFPYVRAYPTVVPVQSDLRPRITDDINIRFVGNDYICVEESISNTESKNNKMEYKILPIDKLEANGEDIVKIFGKEADSALKKSGEIYSRRTYGDVEYNTSLGLIRRSGRWVLRGRVLPSSSKALPYVDFDIPYAPPRTFTAYDDLYPPFNIIKQEVPDALDAFTSPNRDFVVVVTNSKLLLKPIVGNNLGDTVMKIDLNEEETVIMSQWSLGRYVEDWAKWAAFFEK